MIFDLPSLRVVAGTVSASLILATAAAQATPLLVMDATSGAVIYEQDSTKPWYPASLTKLVTVYAALKAVKEHRISLDTPMVVSTRAARMPPSKMGFKPGTEVTLDNALKMLMVKSANDLAVVIAEGVSGSVENFAVEMNQVAANLGMRQSHFVNPNGLSPISGNGYRTSLASGTFSLKAPGASGAGALSPSTLEASTVDLSSEFTGLIVTQRAYSASSKIITTADQMLQELISIIR